MTTTEVPLPPAAEATTATTTGSRPASRRRAVAAALRGEWIKAATVRTNKVLLATSAIVGLDSWQGYLASRSPAWVESFLLFCLLSSFVVIAMVQAAHYWRDRR